jgi:hypothetical protein
LEGIERVLVVTRANGADRCHQCPSYVRSDELLVTPPSDGAKDLGHGAPTAMYFNMLEAIVTGRSERHSGGTRRREKAMRAG